MITNLAEAEDMVWDLRPRIKKTAEAVGLLEPESEIHPVVNAVSAELEPTVT